MRTSKVFTKSNNGKVSKVVEFSTGKRVELPVNKDGSIKWYSDKKKGGAKNDR